MVNSRVTASRGMIERRFEWFNDFFPNETNAGNADLATLYPGGIAVLDGTDTQATQLVLIDTYCGVCRLTSGSASSPTAATCNSGIGTGLIFIPGTHGTIVAECRLTNNTAVTNRRVFFGWVDVCDDGNLEDWWSLSVATFTSNATDAAGFLFDTDATNDYWHAVSVNNGTDTLTRELSSDYNPVAATEQTFRVTLSADRFCEWWINGHKVAERSAAVANVALAAAVQVSSTAANTSALVDVDYLYAAGNREQP